MKKCKECEYDISPRKKWGYANVCELCDQPESINKSMGVMIADGKTDYHFEIVENPSNVTAAKIRASGLAHDPRSQLSAINKVSS